MILTIEELGAQAGKRAAELYKARKRDGTQGGIRGALPDAIKAAALDASKFKDSASEDERSIAIYWANYAARRALQPKRDRETFR